MIEAFALAPAGVLAPFSYVQIVAATIVGILFFDAVPDGWTLLGVAMIVGAGVAARASNSASRRRAGNDLPPTLGMSVQAVVSQEE